MKVVAIIQARMGSTRLPGKVLKDLGGESVLSRVVRRSQRAKLIDEIIVATTTEPQDEQIVSESERLGVSVFCGQEQDVLDRYYQAAMKFKADAIVRITSDCPLVDPEVIDKIIGSYLSAKVDYASNILDRTYPTGLDVEAIGMNALARAWKEANESFQRVHVTPYIYQNPNLFVLRSVVGDKDYSAYRWTVDTREDLEFARTMYDRLGNRNTFSWRDALGVLAQNPVLADINRHIHKKALQEG
jgi:spore coat polysaccharide biosynthesis protein SpsF